VLGQLIDASMLKFIIDLGLLSVFTFKNQKLILKSDLTSLIDVLNISKGKDAPRLQCRQLIEQDVININSNTHIDLVHEDYLTIPTFFSATRNLISAHRSLLNEENNTELNMPYFPSARLTSTSENVIEYAKKQLDREKKIDINTISQFARSAHYMGSKRALCGFIAEGISSVLPDHGIVVDLMCGSGVASGSFSRIWKTYASDAQEFCRILAVIHGGGFDRKAAQNLLSRISPIFKRHFYDLNRNLSDTLKREEKIFCSNTSEVLLQEYKHFMQTFPTLINLNNTIQWNPEEEVMQRKRDHLLYPYCLFTSYFANVYFGVRQSVEIDSLRFSIDQLQDDNEKCWALGALIASVSALGTTYGGHFAQPKVSGYENINIDNITSVIDKRSPSIIHEFSVRLLNLSEQSQNAFQRIESVPGPWNNALTILGDKIKQQPVLVYLDAPYTRDEYSRYYHVLETLVTYTYPSCTGIGLTPKPNERFKSEFFTKVESKILDALVNVITNILHRDWMCAWSYSDSGVANIYQVINSVHQKTNCDVKSYSAPFRHKSQGPRKNKTVVEHLIIFSPRQSSAL
jgi:adenine-specific DNA methylase